MVKMRSLVAKLRTDYPDIAFAESDDFYWSAPDNTVYFDAHTGEAGDAMLLHELAHARLKHADYTRDIDLVRLERDAWELARYDLAPAYGVTVNDEAVEEMIDTYRDWLHARSRCPSCAMTGVQTDRSTYHCVGCGQDWRVNEARRCGLKRYRL